ncbi:MAG: type-2 restriction enzyme TthHB8I [Armatimonadota bacterium]|nr:MAG: type-2 restriction enzyme TthHB8I [Armatimonadota bacterium]
MSTAETLLKGFEGFLGTIPLDKYRQELLSVKTVEQDLPKDLNPLPDIYKQYWTDSSRQFPDYESFFEQWWKDHLAPIDEFVKHYFWGCSYEFVRLGFKARLYRTLISVLTQFHFSYAWRAFCTLPIETSAEMDMHGIDALVRFRDIGVALQMKKETYRPEARKSGRFVQKQLHAKILIELPYTIVSSKEWEQRKNRARDKRKKEEYALFHWLSTELQRWLPNGFVVFQDKYPRLVEQFIEDFLSGDYASQDHIGWDELLKKIHTLSGDHLPVDDGSLHGSAQ